MMQGLFFTGTDTSAGKTVVTAGVARLLRKQGHNVRVCKPVATGANQIEDRWVSDDTLRLAEAAGMSAELEAVTPFSFEEAVAPPVAADQHGTFLKLDALADAVKEQARPGAAMLVEGVGGLLCPLTEKETVADLVKALCLPVVIVARRSLGTLNHTLMTVEVARARGLNVVGVVVSETRPVQHLADQTNVDELRHRLSVPIMAVVPHQADPFASEQPALAAVDWWKYCQSGQSKL